MPKNKISKTGKISQKATGKYLESTELNFL
jgi:hypothetical protein